MEWLYSLFVEHSALQAVVVLSLISAIGLGLGKIHICGISLGVTFVFFAGILAGHFGLSIDPQMLNYAESFGLVIFVYALGLQVGPGFFSSFRKGGVRKRVSLRTLLLLIAAWQTVVLIIAANNMNNIRFMVTFFIGLIFHQLFSENKNRGIFSPILLFLSNIL